VKFKRLLPKYAFNTEACVLLSFLPLSKLQCNQNYTKWIDKYYSFGLQIPFHVLGETLYCYSLLSICVGPDSTSLPQNRRKFINKNESLINGVLCMQMLSQVV